MSVTHHPPMLNETTVRSPNPYVGPRAFESTDTLFGRDVEVRQLRNLLIAERIVLLYSPSGAGKTSLLQAGLLPQLHDSVFTVLPMICVNRAPVADDGGLMVENRFVFSMLQSLDESLPPAQRTTDEDLAQMTVEAYLDRREQLQNDIGNDLFTLLVFDQFEEILTIDSGDQTQKALFFWQVGEALRNQKRWALFAMREEYLAALDPFIRPIPTRFHTRYRLELLGEAAARQAIERPAEIAGVRFDGDAFTLLLDDLRLVQEQTLGGEVRSRLGAYVEPLQLQVVCWRLWDVWTKCRPDASTIQASDVREMAVVDNALGDYFAEQSQSIAVSTDVPERVIRNWFEHQLITPQGFRAQVMQSFANTELMPDSALTALIDAHLVRSEQRRGATWLELTHDRLIRPIQENNMHWRAQHENILQRQARLWASAPSHPDAYLLQGDAFLDACTYANALTTKLTRTESDYFQVCLKGHAAANQKARLQRWIRIWAVVATIALLTILALAWILQQEAQLSLSRQLAAQSEVLLGSHYDLALLLASEAYGTAPTVEARGSLVKALQYNSHLESVLRGHKGAIWDVAYTPDGEFLLSGSLDGSVILWDLDQLHPRSSVSLGNGQKIKAIAVNPDGTSMVVGALDGTVAVVALGDELETQCLLEARFSKIDDLVFSPDGRRLVVAASNGVSIWNAVSLCQMTEPDDVIARSIPTVAVSPDGRSLVIGDSDGGIVLWDLASRKAVSLDIGMQVSAVNSIAFRPDGTKIAFGVAISPTANSKAGTVEHGVALWDIASQSAIWMNGHTNSVWSLGFHPSGTILASGSEDRRILLWDAQSGQRLGESLSGHADSVLGLCFSSNGQLASSGRDGNITLWDISTTARLGVTLMGHEDEVYAVAVSDDLTTLATAGKDKQVILWDMASYTVAEKVDIGTAEIAAIAISGDGTMLAAGDEEGMIRVWLLPLSTVSTPMQFSHCTDCAIRSVVFSPDSKTLAAGGRGSPITLWDVVTSVAIGKLQSDNNNSHSNVWGLAFSRDGATLIASDDTGVIAFWDVRIAQMRQSIPPDHAESVRPIALRRDDSVLAVGGSGKRMENGAGLDNSVVLYNPSSQKEIGALVGHTKTVAGLAFSPDGKLLATGGYDHLVMLWDVEAQQLIGAPFVGHRAPVNAVAFANGKTLISGNRSLPC